MAYIVIKTIKGRQYRYQQRSYRQGGKVRTETIYLGPVDGGRRRRGLLRRIGDLIEANRMHEALCILLESFATLGQEKSHVA